MRDKWVDIDAYFGPDRRRREGRKPWRDRRQQDEAKPRQALGALLRRVRVQLLDMNGPEHRRRALQVLEAAMAEAQRQQQFACLDTLRRAQAALRTGAAADLRVADSALSEAMALAANNGA